MNFYFVIVVVILIILVIACMIMNSINSSKINNMLSYAEDGDLGGVMEKYFNKVSELANSIKSKSDNAMIDRIEKLEAKSLSSLSHMGVVNFDAFDDVKGNLSFSLTLLDDCGDGFILTSLYGHNSNNTYVRKIESGEAQVKLLDEELQSLEMAKSGVKSDDKQG